MYNIVVCCVSALSSSILVSKMKKAAKDINFNCLIWTVGEAGLDLAYGDADVILLAPQVRHVLPKLEAQTRANHQVPVIAISDIDFGKMDGEAILQSAINAIKK